jgi:hypothetical protein
MQIIGMLLHAHRISNAPSRMKAIRNGWRQIIVYSKSLSFHSIQPVRPKKTEGLPKD